MKPILVTCYVDPDLDGTAGVVAYSEYLNKTGVGALAGVIGIPHDEAKYVLDRFNIKYPNSIFGGDDFDKIILVDCSDLNGLNGKVEPEKVVEIIDHRKIHEAHKFPNAKAQIELVGAAATLVAEKFMQDNVEISKESAILLLSAIISSTSNFKGSVSTDRDQKAAVWLNKIADLDPGYWRDLFLAKSDLDGKKLFERIEGDLAWFDIGDKKIGIAQIEMIGAQDLIDKRVVEIVNILQYIKNNKKFDYIFLNAVELEQVYNIFVTGDIDSKTLLEKVLGIEFVGNAAKRSNLIMRKQLVPLLKEELEEN
ncbi:MAG: DHHA2 domain-containing protein [Candidatus Magasanikbacteria bacterium]